MRSFAVAALLFSTALNAQTGQYNRFGVSCPGSNQTLARISVFLPPSVGKLWSVSITNALQSTPVVLVFGTSTTSWGPIPLPFDLAPLGAAGCNVYTDVLFADGLFTNVFGAIGNGKAYPIPADPSLVGAFFHNQFYVADLFANAAGVTTSEGGTAIIGM